MHRKKLALVISTFIDSFIFIFSVSIANALPNNAPLTPSSSKTPGDVLTQDTSVICQRNYTKTVRDVPEMLKTQVYQSSIVPLFLRKIASASMPVNQQKSRGNQCLRLPQPSSLPSF